MLILISALLQEQLLGLEQKKKVIIYDTRENLKVIDENLKSGKLTLCL